MIIRGYQSITRWKDDSIPKNKGDMCVDRGDYKDLLIRHPRRRSHLHYPHHLHKIHWKKKQHTEIHKQQSTHNPHLQATVKLIQIYTHTA